MLLRLLTIFLSTILMTFSGHLQADIFDKLEKAHDCAQNGNCNETKKLGALVKTQKCLTAGNCDQEINKSLENNQEKIRSGIAKVVAVNNKKAEMDRCLTTTDPDEQARCKETSKADYAAVKESYRNHQAKKAEKAAKEAEPYRWDQKTLGGDVRLCTRGKSKPLATVLSITPSKVLIQITQSGGNVLHYYSVGEKHWLNKDQIGC